MNEFALLQEYVNRAHDKIIHGSHLMAQTTFRATVCGWLRKVVVGYASRTFNH